jgi:hypothetical protein
LFTFYLTGYCSARVAKQRELRWGAFWSIVVLIFVVSVMWYGSETVKHRFPVPSREMGWFLWLFFWVEKTFKHAAASEAGDYYQLSFDDGDDYDAKDIGGRYFLIQRQFEFPDDGTYYLESDDSRFAAISESEPRP